MSPERIELSMYGLKIRCSANVSDGLAKLVDRLGLEPRIAGVRIRSFNPI
jgi:hypothetical protein